MTSRQPVPGSPQSGGGELLDEEGSLRTPRRPGRSRRERKRLGNEARHQLPRLAQLSGPADARVCREPRYPGKRVEGSGDREPSRRCVARAGREVLEVELARRGHGCPRNDIVGHSFPQALGSRGREEQGADHEGRIRLEAEEPPQVPGRLRRLRAGEEGSTPSSAWLGRCSGDPSRRCQPPTHELAEAW